MSGGPSIDKSINSLQPSELTVLNNRIREGSRLKPRPSETIPRINILSTLN